MIEGAAALVSNNTIYEQEIARLNNNIDKLNNNIDELNVKIKILEQTIADEKDKYNSLILKIKNLIGG